MARLVQQKFTITKGPSVRALIIALLLTLVVLRSVVFVYRSV